MYEKHSCEYGANFDFDSWNSTTTTETKPQQQNQQLLELQKRQQKLDIIMKKTKIFNVSYARHCSEFAYNPDEGLNVSAYFRRYEQIFRNVVIGNMREKRDFVVEENRSDIWKILQLHIT